MKGLLIALLMLVPALAGADVYPALMPGANDTERTQAALDVAARIKDFVVWRDLVIDGPLEWRAPIGKDGKREPFLQGVGLRGNGDFGGVRFTGNASLDVYEGKRIVLDRATFLAEASERAAVTFHSSASSSSLTAQSAFFQGFKVGMAFVAVGGADISVVAVRDTQFTDCGTAVLVEGPNALDPLFDHVTASGCGRVFDFTKGGAKSSVTGNSGWSGCIEGIVANAGYEGTVSLGSVEDSGTVFRCGGDDAGGSGAPGSFRLFVQDARAVAVLADLRFGGTAHIDALKAEGVVRVENKGSLTATVVLSGATAKLPRTSTGKVVFK